MHKDNSNLLSFYLFHMRNQILISTNTFTDEGQTVIRGDEKALKVGTSQEATRWDLGASKPINWVLDHKFKKFRSMSPFRYPSAADAWHDRRRTGNRASRIAPRWLRPNCESEPHFTYLRQRSSNTNYSIMSKSNINAQICTIYGLTWPSERSKRLHVSLWALCDLLVTS